MFYTIIPEYVSLCTSDLRTHTCEEKGKAVKDRNFFCFLPPSQFFPLNCATVYTRVYSLRFIYLSSFFEFLNTLYFLLTSLVFTSAFLYRAHTHIYKYIVITTHALCIDTRIRKYMSAYCTVVRSENGVYVI